MAFSRAKLKTMNLSEDQIEALIDMHMETVDPLKSDRDEAVAKANKVEALEKELKEAYEKLEAIGSNEWQSKYEEIKKQFDNYKADQTAKETLAVKSTAYRKMLADAGVHEKLIDKVMKVTDLSKVELDGENLKDADKLTESVKEEWADFITTEHKEGAGTDTPPESSEGKAPTLIPSIF